MDSVVFMNYSDLFSLFGTSLTYGVCISAIALLFGFSFRYLLKFFGL